MERMCVKTINGLYKNSEVGWTEDKNLDMKAHCLVIGKVPKDIFHQTKNY